MGDDAINGKLFDLGPFPAAQDGDGIIHGEVYMVGPNTLRDLDTLEGHPDFYERKSVKTKISGHEAWVYFMHDVPKRAVHLPEGVWPK